MTDSLFGWVVEPIRADFHFPARLSDLENLPRDKVGRIVQRVLLALSVRVGIIMFPGGFPADAFNAEPGVARKLPGNEAVFQTGIALNVGRLFGR
jgi:hypothetical protein